MDAISIFSNDSVLTDDEKDELNDIAIKEDHVFFFYRSGVLLCYDINTSQFIYETEALSNEQKTIYNSTSFIKVSDKNIFQLRNGYGPGILLVYDNDVREWKTLLQSDYWLNYISIDADENLWISGHEGLWFIKSDFTEKEFISDFKLADGSTLKTEISTLAHDNQN